MVNLSFLFPKWFLVVITMWIPFGSAYGFSAIVTGTANGDSLAAVVEEKTVTIRLYGIDAPESGQQGSTAAIRFLKSLVVEHPVAVDVLGTDVFGKAVAIVKRPGKESSINAAMVANGYAWVDPHSCNVEVCDRWKRLQRLAKTYRLGIWSGYDLIPPWEYNKQQRR